MPTLRHFARCHGHGRLLLVLVLLAVTVAGVTPAPSNDDTTAAGPGAAAHGLVSPSASDLPLLAPDATAYVELSAVHSRSCGEFDDVVVRFSLEGEPTVRAPAEDAAPPRAVELGVVRGRRQPNPKCATDTKQRPSGSDRSDAAAGTCHGDRGAVWGTPPAHVPQPDEPAWLAFDLGRPVTVAHIVLKYSTGASQCPMGVRLQTADSRAGPWETAVALAGGCGSEMMEGSTASASTMKLNVPPGYTSRFWNVSVAGDGRWLGAAAGAAGAATDSVPADLTAAEFVGCDACHRCASGFYAVGACGTQGQECARCSSGTCGAGWFQMHPCTETSDRVCASCSDACPLGQYAVGSCTGFDDVVCAPCPATEALEAGTVIAAVCSRVGTPPLHGARSLSSHCGAGQWAECDDAACPCHTCTVCPASMDQASACSMSANTVCQAASPLVLPSWGVPSLELMVSTATTGTDVRLVVTVDGSNPSCTSIPPSAHTVVSRVTSLTLAESGVVTVKAAACRSGVTGSTVTTQDVYVAASAQDMYRVAMRLRNVTLQSLRGEHIVTFKGVLGDALGVDPKRVVVNTVSEAADPSMTIFELCVALSARDGVANVVPAEVEAAVSREVAANTLPPALHALGLYTTDIEVVGTPTVVTLAPAQPHVRTGAEALLDLHVVLLAVCVAWSVFICWRTTVRGNGRKGARIPPEVHPFTPVVSAGTGEAGNGVGGG